MDLEEESALPRRPRFPPRTPVPEKHKQVPKAHAPPYAARLEPTLTGVPQPVRAKRFAE